ncbi:MAG: DNA translocase FtsK 4TM domain-containing protein [Thiotrichaceae bacterium]
MAVKLNKLKRVSLQQTSVLFFSGVAAIFFLALISYHPDDCGFFRIDSQCVTNNKAGSIGAYLADFLFRAFGFLAYLIPMAMIVVGIVMFRFPHKKNPNNPRGGINAWLSLGGMGVALIAGTGLATLLWPSADLPYFGGGLLGMGVAKVAHSLFGDYGSTLILLSMFFAGMTLAGDIKWGSIVEVIGDKVLALFEYLVHTDETNDALATDAPVEMVAVEEDKKNKSFFEKSTAALTGAGAGAAGLWGWAKNKSGTVIGEAKHRIAPQEIGEIEEDDALLLQKETSAAEQYLSTPSFDDAQSSGKTRKTASAEATSTSVSAKSETGGHASKADQSAKKTKARSLNKVVSLPPLSILSPPPADQGKYNPEHLDTMANNIIEALGHFGVRDVTVDKWYPGPVITRFELQLDSSTKVSKVSNLAKDLARNLGVHSVRIVEVIPGKTTIGFEVPNEKRDMVTIGSVLESTLFANSPSAVTMALGKDISGHPVIADLAKMPHLLVAGTTGAGKSVAVNAMIISFLYKSTAEEVRMIMIDPKMLELSIYDDIPHLLTPVVTDMKDAASALRWCVAEMERRYLLMSKLKVRNVAGFNVKVQDAIDRGEPIIDPLYDATKSLEVTPKSLETLPQIVIVVDEFADMMMIVGKKVEELITRLAQKARAAGIHLILATQRPSVDVITGLIKANIPTRIAFNVSTRVDSRTILDQGGAEQLLGQGDMLYLPPGTAMPNRVHGAYVSDQEVEDVVAYVKTQGEPEYINAVIEEAPGNSSAIPGLEPLVDKSSESDPLYDEAVHIITESRRASISYLQRRLKVGYNRAATMIEDMEQAGVVSAVQSNGTREVIAPAPVTDNQGI